MTNVIVYSFKGYDTAKHRHILRPAKATLERIRRIHDAVAVAGLGEELRLSMVDGDGFSMGEQHGGERPNTDVRAGSPAKQ